MSNYDQLLTISQEEASVLDRAAETAIGMTSARSDNDRHVLEQSVLWAAESSQPFPEGVPTAQTIADLAVLERDRFEARSR